MSTSTSDWPGTRSSRRSDARREIARALGSARSVVLFSVALFVLTVLSRLPFLTTVPYAWDSVLYLRAMANFDVASGQPHPPGYVFYVLTARLLGTLLSSAHGGLVAESVLGAGLAVALTFAFGARLVGRAGGLIAAGLLAVSPPFWVYSGVAYPYTVLAAASVLLAMIFYDRRTVVRWPGIAGMALGAVGGYRTDLTLFLTPLLAAAIAWRSHFRPFATLGRLVLAGIGGFVGIVLWVLPSAQQSGGVVRYLTILANQSDYVGESYSVLSQGTEALLMNSGQVFRFLGDALGVAWPFALIWLVSPLVPLARARGRCIRVLFVACWIVPMITFHCLIHIGDRGYTFAYVPALCIAAGGGVVWSIRVAQRLLHSAWLGRHRWAAAERSPRPVLGLMFGRDLEATGWVAETLDLLRSAWTRLARGVAEPAEPAVVAVDERGHAWGERLGAGASLDRFPTGRPSGVLERVRAAASHPPVRLLRQLAARSGSALFGLARQPQWPALLLGAVLIAGSARSFFFDTGRMTAADIRCFSPAIESATRKIRAYFPPDRAVLFASFFHPLSNELLPEYESWFFDPVGSPRYVWQIPAGIDYVVIFGEDLPVNHQPSAFWLQLPCNRRLYYFKVDGKQELLYRPGERIYLRRSVDPLVLNGRP